jgi:hypothetical protein
MIEASLRLSFVSSSLMSYDPSPFILFLRWKYIDFIYPAYWALRRLRASVVFKLKFDAEVFSLQELDDGLEIVPVLA